MEQWKKENNKINYIKSRKKGLVRGSMKKSELKSLPFMDSSLDLEKRVEDLLGRLMLDEKFKLCAGSWWNPFQSGSVKRLGIKALKMTDGPHGVGALGTFFMKKTTYFPTAICRCATWNPELSEKFGVAVAQEVRDIGYHLLFAPGINIQRTPLCGRNFEYQTEDPFLNKVMAVKMVKGVQSQRISVCVKHYICNNQDINRFRVSAEVGERALREIYSPAFEASVREADAWSFMACYNQINGKYGCENKKLIKETLMDEWGFRGFVISDYGATRNIKNAEDCVNAGLSLDQPNIFNRTLLRKKNLRRAFEAGKFAEETLNENVRRILRVMFLVGMFDEKSTLPPGSRNTPEHQAIARKIAEEGIVLLKNDNNLLPLDIEKTKKLAVIGPNAKKKFAGCASLIRFLFENGGSSMVRPKYEITPLKGLKGKCRGKVEIVTEPAEADVTIIFTGLNHKMGMDCENSDRSILELPEKQIELIKTTIQENPKTVVVLINGSPVAMEGWLDKVPAVIEAWYAGCDAGNAIADVIFGDVNPSGKLPITFPKKLEDSPAHKSEKTYPGEKIYNEKGKVIDEKVYYEEGIFVGYRHFDTRDIEPLFPFGYGLSYTTFAYEDLKFDKNTISEKDTLAVSVKISNSGERAGAEVVQLYVQDVKCSVERPVKELKGFKKVNLSPGEKQTVTFELTKQDLSFFDEKENRWKAEKGKFKILVGSSSRDIRLEGEIEYLG